MTDIHNEPAAENSMNEAMIHHRTQLEERSKRAADWLDDTVQQIVEEKQECQKQTGAPLDPVAMKAHLQNSVAIGMPMDQAVTTIAEAVWRLAETQEKKSANISSLFLPNSGGS